MNITLTPLSQEGTSKARRFAKDRIAIGRDPASDLAFDPEADRVVGTRHAEIRIENGQFVLYDLGSRNGTFVNGKKIEERAVLQNGNVIQFGADGPKLRCQIDSTAPDEGFAHATDATRPLDREATLPLHARSVSGEATVPLGDVNTSLPPKTGPGARTVQLWIKDAMDKARQNPGTQFIRLVVDKATHSSRRTTQKYVGGLAVVTLLLVGGVFTKGELDKRSLIQQFTTQLEGVQQALETQLAQTDRQIAALEALVAEVQAQVQANSSGLARLTGSYQQAQARLAQLNTALQAERQQRTALEQQVNAAQNRLGELDSRMASVAGSFRTVAADAKESIFMLALLLPNGARIPFCSGFAVRADVIFTNGHCYYAFEEYAAAGLPFTPIVIQNERPDIVYEIIQRGVHPDYDDSGTSGGPNPDVAFVRVNTGARPLKPLPLAPASELASLGSGYEIALFGYPGEIMNPDDPTATLFPGTVGRLPAGGWRIQHTCLSSQGTSGSALLNTRGQVVGIHNAGEGTWVPVPEIGADGQTTMTLKKINRAGISYGIHGRYLNDFLATIR